MKSIKILFCIGCIFILCLCMGCAASYINQKGKVNHQFLEEHKAAAKSQPPMDYEKEGVNTKNLFIFTDTTMTYNGKSFMPGMTIGELCKIFGQYERLAEPKVYVWDSMGLTAYTLDECGKDNAFVEGIRIHWIIKKENDMEWLPYHYFKDKIIVGGAVLGRGMHINQFLKNTSLELTNRLSIPNLYYTILHNWNYIKTPIHRKNKCYSYCIITADDGSDIEGFSVDIFSRNI